MLKPDRNYSPADSDISFYMGETADAGIMVVYPTGDVSPPGLDDDANYVTVPTDTSEKAVGILMNTVVNLDLSRTELSSHLNEVQINNKVEIIRRGWFVTNKLASSITPSPGDPLYFAATGVFTTATGSEIVGRFESGVNSDGYARIFVDVK